MRRFVRNEPEPAESQEVAQVPADPDTRRADIILVDHEISPSQARNLEKEAGCEVMDRTMVILEIFHRHARSRAARAQVEIARLGYMAPRMREAAKLAGPQGRQRSGVGGRGAGESRMELDRRKIRDRIAELEQELAAMGAERKTQRARRQERPGLARVALVGYTNAGKSTWMRALTGRGLSKTNSSLRSTPPARAVSRERAARAGHRHRRIHQEPAARPRCVVQVDARGGGRGVAAHPRHRCERSRI
jgi:GTP-binding protein HflX